MPRGDKTAFERRKEQEVTMSGERVAGTVKWFNDEKGYGLSLIHI